MSEDSGNSREQLPRSLPAEIVLYVELGYTAKEQGEVEDAIQYFDEAVSRIDTRVNDCNVDEGAKEANEIATLQTLLSQQKARLVEEIERLSG